MINKYTLTNLDKTKFLKRDGFTLFCINDRDKTCSSTCPAFIEKYGKDDNDKYTKIILLKCIEQEFIIEEDIDD